VRASFAIAQIAIGQRQFHSLRYLLPQATRCDNNSCGDLIHACLPEAHASTPFDFSTAININVTKAKDEKAIPQFEAFVESICRFCDTYRGNDPAWGFSDYMAKQLLRSGLKALVLSLLPKALTADARKAFHFAVEDISL
jgi:hypothetical protein